MPKKRNVYPVVGDRIADCMTVLERTWEYRGTQRFIAFRVRYDSGIESVIRYERLKKYLRDGMSRPRLGPLLAATRKLIRLYKLSARKRKIAWDLDDEDFFKLIKLDCHYCGAPPSPRLVYNGSSVPHNFNGIDRINSKLGYSNDNCVSACGICNVAKLDLSRDIFLSHVGRIYHHVFNSVEAKSTEPELKAIALEALSHWRNALHDKLSGTKHYADVLEIDKKIARVHRLGVTGLK